MSKTSISSLNISQKLRKFKIIGRKHNKSNISKIAKMKKKMKK
jgi:hypothetical protein